MDNIDIQDEPKGRVKIGVITTYRSLLLAGVALIGYFQHEQSLESEQDRASNVEILFRINSIETKLSDYQNETREKLHENKLALNVLQRDLNDTKEKYLWNNPAFRSNVP